MVVLVTSPAARSAPLTHDIRWTRSKEAAGCVDERTLLERVTTRLGDRPTHRGSRVIAGHVELTADGFRAHIVVSDRHGAVIGERELVEASADCRRLDDKLVLVVAMLLDRPEPPPPPVAVQPARVEQTPVSSKSGGWGSGLGVSTTTAVGMLPGMSLSGRVSVVIDPPATPAIVASLSGWLPRTETADMGASRFTLVGGALAACPRLWARGAFGMSACLGAEVSWIGARGRDFDSNQHTSAWLAHVTADTSVTLAIAPRWTASLGLVGWIPLVRPRFFYSDGMTDRTLYQAPSVAGGLRVGIQVAL
ncbi:MAG: hypothetical protein AB7R00_19840 [Kofleriaceae bacterium]